MVMSPEQIAADRERWLRQAEDAAIEATLGGATPQQLADAVLAGVREGRRIAAIRRGEVPPVDEPAESTQAA